jgi:NAD(P)-dependent dehydrogenase (short-subunit alcohol dehydrogenase family)
VSALPPIFPTHSKEAHDRIAANTPLRHFGQPDDIANAVLFFCSDYSRFVTRTYLT